MLQVIYLSSCALFPKGVPYIALLSPIYSYPVCPPCLLNILILSVLLVLPHTLYPSFPLLHRPLMHRHSDSIPNDIIPNGIIPNNINPNDINPNYTISNNISTNGRITNATYNKCDIIPNVILRVCVSSDFVAQLY